ncbi:MAG: family 16 glycosylhydrolase [Acidobacteria bacterium]|nr:family 16 glycosylhydrolase [Acidobacteriota bacterium]
MARHGRIPTFDVWRIGVFVLMAAVFLAALAAAMSPPPREMDAASLPRDTSVRQLGGSFVHQFAGKYDETNWLKSDFYYPNSDHPAWKAGLVHFKRDRLELEVRRQKTAYKAIAGGELQRRGFYHFGRYEVVMQAAPGSGTVSAMFTHTHKQFGDPHDEIDIEFLGKDLTRMHANYFTDGKQHGSIYIPLGFDASKQIHLYAFEWDPDEIRWYVDDRLVHTARPSDFPIPQAPGRLMLHLWSGGRDQVSWAGEPTFRDGARAKYYCLSYQAAGDSSSQCSDTFVPRRYKK